MLQCLQRGPCAGFLRIPAQRGFVWLAAAAYGAFRVACLPRSGCSGHQGSMREIAGHKQKAGRLVGCIYIAAVDLVCDQDEEFGINVQAQ